MEVVDMLFVDVKMAASFTTVLSSEVRVKVNVK